MKVLFTAWVSCQIRKIAPEMPGTFSPPPRVSDPDMHHGTCVTHVPWCMPASLTGSFFEVGGGENVPGNHGACATRNFTYLARGPSHKLHHLRSSHRAVNSCEYRESAHNSFSIMVFMSLSGPHYVLDEHGYYGQFIPHAVPSDSIQRWRYIFPVSFVNQHDLMLIYSSYVTTHFLNKHRNERRWILLAN